FQVRPACGLELDWLRFDLFKLFLSSLFFVQPFRGATYRGRPGNGDGFALQDCVDCVSRIAAGNQRFAGIVVDASLVSQFALCVENKEVRGRGRSVGLRDFLCFTVIEVGKIEFAVGCANFHFFEAIADIGVAHFIEPNGLWTVRLYGDQSDTASTIVVGELFDPALIELCGWAMIAGKSDYQNLAAGIALHTVILPVDAGEAEVRCGRAYL